MLSLALLELTVQELVAGIPRDGGALFVLILFVALGLFIWHGSRDRGPTNGAAPRADALPSDPAAPEAAARQGGVAEPAGEPVSIHLSTLSTAPDVRRLHPEVR